MRRTAGDFIGAGTLAVCGDSSIVADFAVGARVASHHDFARNAGGSIGKGAGFETPKMV